MSNLHAALGWALVDLVGHPAELAAVVAGDAALAERCALESTRLAQRSIMARTVLQPVTFDTGAASYDVPPGWTIATLLPLLNTTAAPGLAEWDPAAGSGTGWPTPRMLASPQLVTAFGHGRHSCPAQPFSLAAMTAAMTRLGTDVRADAGLDRPRHRSGARADRWRRPGPPTRARWPTGRR